MNMDDDLRAKLVPVSDTQMAHIAEVCNRYPNVDLEFDLDETNYQDGQTATVTVTIKRLDVEDDEDLQRFASPASA
jgi:pre-mRNA-splicing helicase BRR2